MPEAVIVALGRSPIGRARKGSLVDVRPDDLAAYVVNKVLEKVPELDHSEIEDLIVSGSPAAHAAMSHNGAVAAGVAGGDDLDAGE